MHKGDHEVIVVGAGPAGALTAALLARRGRRVLLLDRDDFPRDKICGEAVPFHALESLHEAGMEEWLAAALSTGELHPLQQTRLVAPGGRAVVSPLHTSERGYRPCISLRRVFDTMIRDYAVVCGASFQQAVVEGVLGGEGGARGILARVDGAAVELPAAVVVGADGVNSVVGRALRGRCRHLPRHRALALRGYISGLALDPGEVEFYFYREILPGYAWIFPLGDNRANIGLGMRLDHYRQKKENLNGMLSHFLSLPRVSARLRPGWKVENTAAWPLDFGSQRGLRYAFAGALLVGDAAGLINPLTGGGIRRSLTSAELAARVIDEALQRGDHGGAGLMPYERQVRRALVSEMRNLYYLQALFLRLPFLVDWTARFLQGDKSWFKRYAAKL